jgi:uncharacterized protein involved in outer membrane biogenesis
MKTRNKVLAGVALAALGLAAAAPWLVPTSTWKGPLEAAASEALGAPVTLGAIDIVLLPLPHLTLRDVDVGKGALRLASAAVHPELLSLFSAPRRLRNIELKQLQISPQGLALLQRLAEKSPAGPPAVEIARLRARDVRVTLDAGPLPPLDASVELGALNLPLKLAVATLDGKAKVAAVPDADGWKLDIAAADWPLPFGPSLILTGFKAAGRADRQRLALSNVEARLYGGLVSGEVEIAWAKGLHLAGKGRAVGVDIAPLLQALKVQASLSGHLEASGNFNAQAAEPAGMPEALRADIAFKVENGVLHGFDLANAAKNLFKGGSGGGQTRFDQLTGNVQVAGRALRLRNLKVASGVLDARGNVDVAASRHLGGRVDVDLKGTGGFVGMPLAVSGTLANPVLLPTKGALAGAALGTVLLPGVGTSLGSSIGDRIGRMFGK